jgi:hypothetical protein
MSTATETKTSNVVKVKSVKKKPDVKYNIKFMSIGEIEKLNNTADERVTKAMNNIHMTNMAFESALVMHLNDKELDAAVGNATLMRTPPKQYSIKLAIVEGIMATSGCNVVENSEIEKRLKELVSLTGFCPNMLSSIFNAWYDRIN